MSSIPYKRENTAVIHFRCDYRTVANIARFLKDREVELPASKSQLIKLFLEYLEESILGTGLLEPTVETMEAITILSEMGYGDFNNGMRGKRTLKNQLDKEALVKGLPTEESRNVAAADKARQDLADL